LSAIRIRRQAQVAAPPTTSKEINWVERSLVCRERLQDIIESCHRVFVENAPGFSLQRGFYEGSYVISTAADEWRLDRAGSSNKYFSSVCFYLAPRLAERAFDVRCKLIVRNREVEVEADESRVLFEDEDLSGFRQFAEDQFCRFAHGYFANDDT